MSPAEHEVRRRRLQSSIRAHLLRQVADRWDRAPRWRRWLWALAGAERPAACPVCHGARTVSAYRHARMVGVETCPRCHGGGYVD